MATKKQKLVEIARSFSWKINLGNYEMADIFCSQKSEVSEKDAVKVSEMLYEFCKNEVIKSANKYLKEVKEPKPEIKPIKEEKIPEPVLQQGLDTLKEIQEKDLPF